MLTFCKNRHYMKFRSSYRSCSLKKGVWKNFTNFTEKRLCWSPFLTKLQAFRLFSGVFPSLQGLSCKICEILRTPILRNIYEQMLLEVQICTVKLFHNLWRLNKLLTWWSSLVTTALNTEFILPQPSISFSEDLLVQVSHL